MLVHGKSSGNPSYDVISQTLSRQKIFNLIQNRCGYKVGMLKYIIGGSNGQSNTFIPPNHGDLLTVESAINYVNGWIYPNGSMISKDIFPDLFRYLQNINYEGKSIDSTKTKITLPNINKMFKLNPNNIQDPLTAQKQVEGRYDLPTHSHTIGQNKEDDYVITTETTKTGTNKMAIPIYMSQPNFVGSTVTKNYANIDKKCVVTVSDKKVTTTGTVKTVNFPLLLLNSDMYSFVNDINDEEKYDVVEDGTQFSSNEILPDHIQTTCLIYTGKVVLS